jgi:hypothetical protein
MDMLRSSVFGQFARFLSRGRYLSHNEELARFEELLREFERTRPKEDHSSKSATDEESFNSAEGTRTSGDEYKLTQREDGLILTGWYSKNDPENPQNWGSLKKYLVGLLIW